MEQNFEAYVEKPLYFLLLHMFEKFQDKLISKWIKRHVLEKALWHNNIIEFLCIVTANQFHEKLRGWDILPPPPLGSIRTTE